MGTERLAATNLTRSQKHPALYNIPQTAPINPTTTAPSTTPKADLAPSFACAGKELLEELAVGAGPVFPGVVTVTSMTDAVPPGNTQVHELLVGQAEGPVVPLHVVVCPVQVTDAGQVEIVTIVVEVIVELG